MTIGERIKARRISLGLNADDLADRIGKNRATVFRYENGDIENMPYPAIAEIAKALQTTPTLLLGLNEESFNPLDLPGILPLPTTYKVPRLGTIVCGEPIAAEENYDGEDDVPEGIKCDFTLICKGDSMIGERINDGDIVYIRQQEVVPNGKIAAVSINGETTLKKFFQYPGMVQLRPANDAYPELTYTGEELNDIRVIGQAVGFTSAIK